MIALVVAVILGIYLFLIFLLTIVVYRETFFIHIRTRQEAIASCLERGDFEPSFLDLVWQEFSIASPRGFDLKGSLLPSEKAGAPTILLIHGITWSRYFVFKFAKVFIREGWNIAAIDLAGHGESAAPTLAFPTYGLRDKEDVAAVFAYLSARFPESSAFGLAGESLGAATALQYNAIAPLTGRFRLSFVIADCSYSSIGEEVVYQLKKRGLPRPIGIQVEALVSFISKWRRGFFLEEPSPADAVLAASSPVLFIHGIEDRFVPSSMSIAMYNAMIKAGKPAELFLMPGAGHGKSWLRSPEVWEAVVIGFVRACLAGEVGKGRGPAAQLFPLDKSL